MFFLRPIIVSYYFHNLILEDNVTDFLTPQNYLEDNLQKQTKKRNLHKFDQRLLLSHENINLDYKAKEKG